MNRAYSSRSCTPTACRCSATAWAIWAASLKTQDPATRLLYLREVIGRDTDRIWLPDGRWITGLQIPHMMKDYPVREYMFTQRKDYSIEIKIVPRDGFGEHSRRRILATVQANLPGLNITTQLVDEIPRTRANKWRPVVSEVAGPRYRKSA